MRRAPNDSCQTDKSLMNVKIANPEYQKPSRWRSPPSKACQKGEMQIEIADHRFGFDEQLLGSGE
jgi:hypothetical protein